MMDLVGSPKREQVSEPALPPRFEELYRAQLGYVVNSLRRLGVHERDLEDVAHDVFFAVYRQLSAFDPSRPIRPWLFGFAYRIATDYRRLVRHRHEGPVLEREPAGLSTPQDEEVDRERRRRLLLHALERIDLERRALLIMHDIDGHTMPEIARELAIPLNTAYSRLRLARRDLEAAVLDIAPPEVIDR
jgi:RNA polymerase sigma-70 factor (ECF subfamily)